VWGTSVDSRHVAEAEAVEKSSAANSQQPTANKNNKSEFPPLETNK